MVRHYMTLFDLAFLLARQSVKHLAEMFSRYFEESFAAILRRKYDVILALPLGMAQASVVVFHGFFCGLQLWTAHKHSPMEDRTISQTLRVSPAEPGAFLLR